MSRIAQKTAYRHRLRDLVRGVDSILGQKKESKGKSSSYGAGFFIKLPKEVANQFNPHEEDSSPPHVTFLYAGTIEKEQEKKAVAIAEDVFSSYLRHPVRAVLDGVDYFDHPDKGRRVAYVKVRFDVDMAQVRWTLRDRLIAEGFNFDDDMFPLIFRPHVALEYMEGLDSEYEGEVPGGSWSFDEMELWNGDSKTKVKFGEGKQVSLEKKASKETLGETLENFDSIFSGGKKASEKKAFGKDVSLPEASRSFLEAWEDLKEGMVRAEEFLYELDPSLRGKVLSIYEKKHADDVMRSGTKRAWTRVISTGGRLIDGLLAQKEPPKKDQKKFDMAARLFKSAKRPPKDIVAWEEKNRDKAQFILEGARIWGDLQEGGDSLFRLGPFMIHNTIGASDQQLDLLKDQIKEVTQRMKSMQGGPDLSKVFYGDIYVVAQLKAARTLAWWEPSSDLVAVRLVVPSKVHGFSHNLIHELGHREWEKFLPRDQKRAWAIHHGEVGARAFRDDIEKVKTLEVGDILPVKVSKMPRGWEPTVDHIEGGQYYFKVNRNGQEKMLSIPMRQIYNMQAKNLRETKKRQSYPTPYASRDYEEHFCEALALKVLGELPPEHLEAFNRIFGGGGLSKQALVLDESRVKTWNSDLRKMTKIYRSIPTDLQEDFGMFEDEAKRKKAEKLWDEAKRLFKNFANNFEKEVFSEILPPFSEVEQTWWDKELRQKAWRARLAINDLFPDSWDGRNEGGYVNDFSRLKANRDKNINSYQKAFREVFEALSAYFRNEGSREKKEDERVQIGGFNVLIEHSKNLDYITEEELKSSLQSLGRLASEIKRAGFGQGVYPRTVLYDFEMGKNSQSYNYTDDIVNIHYGGVGDDDTFVHELGHRFYFVILSEKAIHHWEQVVGKEQGEIYQEDVYKFVEKYGPLIMEREQEGYGAKETERELASLIQSSQDDGVQKARYEYLAKHLPIKMGTLNEIRDGLEFQVGKRVSVHLVTNYGSTNPREAFAEAFKIYIKKGPRALDPWVRKFFEHIVRYGKLSFKTARVIDQNVVKKWTSDLKRMTKLYRSIPTDVPEDDRKALRQWSQVQKFFTNFADNFEREVFGVILPARRDRENWTEEQLRVKAWEADMSVASSSLFPESWDYRTETHVPSFDELGRVRDKNIRRYQKVFREFFELLEYYFIGVSPKEVKEDERLQIGGFNVLIQHENNDGIPEEVIAASLRSLGMFAGKVKKAGFGRAVYPKAVIYDFGTGENIGPSGAAQSYDIDQDIINIHRMGMYDFDGHGSFIHEIGHRFFERILSEKAKQHWFTTIFKGQTVVSKREIKKFVFHYGPNILDMKKADKRIREIREEYLKIVKDDGWDELEEAIMVYLADHIPQSAETLEELSKGLRLFDSSPVAVHHITNYGATDPGEAFAEAFRLYIRNGPRALDPWVRKFFEHIVRYGKLSFKTASKTARVIDKSLVKNWASDLKKLTKIYRAIPTNVSREDAGPQGLKMWKQAKRFFQQFSDKFENEIYSVILPKRNPKTETWLEDQLRKKAWATLLSTYSLFPEPWDHRIQEDAPSFYKLGEIREKNIRKYQGYFREAFEALGYYLDSVEPKIIRDDERLQIGGFNVLIKHSNNKDTSEESLAASLRSLGEFADQVKRAGFGQAVYPRAVIYDFANRGDAAQSYDEGQDIIYIHSWGVFDYYKYGYLVHEIGHRFYDRFLSQTAQDHWSSVIFKGLTSVTPEKINKFVEFYGPLILKMKENKDIWDSHKEVESNLIKRVLSDSWDELEKAVFLYLAKNLPRRPKTLSEFRDNYRMYEGERAAVHHITDYGATNPKEAFAEAFKLYVTKGPRALDPWVQKFFEHIVRNGKLAAKKVSRVKQPWEMTLEEFLISQKPKREIQRPVQTFGDFLKEHRVSPQDLASEPEEADFIGGTLFRQPNMTMNQAGKLKGLEKKYRKLREWRGRYDKEVAKHTIQYDLNLDSSGADQALARVHHKREIAKALSQGKRVPSDILNLYPEMRRVASKPLLYHATSWRVAQLILRSGSLHPGFEGFVSFSEDPLFRGDISSSEVVLVFDPVKLRSQLLKVQYTEDWYHQHPDQSRYIAGEGWREQHVTPEDCYDEEFGEIDDDCEERAYLEAELDSFLYKSNEKEWLSKEEGKSVAIMGALAGLLVSKPAEVIQGKDLLAKYNLDLPVWAGMARLAVERVMKRYLFGFKLELKAGDPVLYGKYKNKKGVVKNVKQTEKGPVVVVTPDPKGKKQDKEMPLLRIRYDESRKKEASSLFVLDDQAIEKMRKDFLALIKNFNQVSSFQQAKELERAIQIWVSHAGRLAAQSKVELEKRVKEWDFGPSQNSEKARWGRNFIGGFYHFWELIDEMGTFYARDDWGGWTPEETAWEKKIRRTARETWKWLHGLSDWAKRDSLGGPGGGGELSFEPIQTEATNIEGFSVVLTGFTGSQKDSQLLQIFRESLKEYKRNAQSVFPMLLRKQVPLRVLFGCIDNRGIQTSCGTSAHYLAQGLIEVMIDRLTGFSRSDFVKVLSHEMGHHLFREFSGKEEKDWGQFIAGDQVPINLRDVLNKIGAGDSVRVIAKTDPILYVQISTLLHSPAYKSYNLFSAEKIRQYLSNGGDPIVYTPKRPVTGYGGKDPAEAFCEAIGLLVAYGPRAVLPEVRDFLQGIYPSLKIANQNVMTRGKTARIHKFSGYYDMKPGMRVKDIADLWLKSDKAYDDSMPQDFQLEDVWQYREFDRLSPSQQVYEKTREHIDQLKKEMSAGWRRDRPCQIQVGKNGKIKVGEGNHRLIAAKELGIKRIPCVFFFYQNVRVATQNYETLDILLKLPGQNPMIGHEKGNLKPDGISKLTSPHGSYRYIYSIGGEPVSALQVVSRDHNTGIVTNSFTKKEHRRQGLARKLLGQIQRDFSILEFNEDQSGSGAAWVGSVTRVAAKWVLKLAKEEQKTAGHTPGDIWQTSSGNWYVLVPGAKAPSRAKTREEAQARLKNKQPKPEQEPKETGKSEETEEKTNKKPEEKTNKKGIKSWWAKNKKKAQGKFKEADEGLSGSKGGRFLSGMIKDEIEQHTDAGEALKQLPGFVGSGFKAEKQPTKKQMKNLAIVAVGWSLTAIPPVKAVLLGVNNPAARFALKRALGMATYKVMEETGGLGAEQLGRKEATENEIKAQNWLSECLRKGIKTVADSDPDTFEALAKEGEDMFPEE